MDPDRFDTVTRFLTRAGSRRRAIAVALSAALGLGAIARPEDAPAAKSGKCKPKCGECERCKRGDCDKRDGKTRCQKGKCKAKGDGTPCGAGTCQGGRCVATPVCSGQPNGTACGERAAGDPLRCCDGVCPAPTCRARGTACAPGETRTDCAFACCSLGVTCINDDCRCGGAASGKVCGSDIDCGSDGACICNACCVRSGAQFDPRFDECTDCCSGTCTPPDTPGEASTTCA